MPSTRRRRRETSCGGGRFAALLAILLCGAGSADALAQPTIQQPSAAGQQSWRASDQRGATTQQHARDGATRSARREPLERRLRERRAKLRDLQTTEAPPSAVRAARQELRRLERRLAELRRSAPRRAPSAAVPAHPSADQDAGAAATGGRSQYGAPEDTGGDPFRSLGGDSPSCARVSGEAADNCRHSGSIAHRYPIGNYGFDIKIDSGFDNPEGGLFSAIQNLLGWIWLGLLYLVKGALLLLEWAFGLNLVNDNMGDVRDGLAKVNRVFGDNSSFFLAAISLAGLIAIWVGFVQRQTIKTLTGLAATVAMMLAALIITHNPTGTVGWLTGQVDEGALSLTSAVYTGKPEQSYDTLGDGNSAIWDAVVLKPWCALQFNDVDFCLAKPPREQHFYNEDGADKHRDEALEAKTVADLWLQFPANGRERNSLYEDWKDDDEDKGKAQRAMSAMKQGSTGSRIAILVLLAVGMIGAILLIGWLAFKLISYSILALFFILVTPVMLLLAAFGESGRRTFASWGKRLLGALIAKALYAVLLGLVLVTAALIGSLDSLGWLALYLLQTVFWWTAFLKRDEIMDWLTLGGGQLADRSNLGSLHAGAGSRARSRAQSGG